MTNKIKLLLISTIVTTFFGCGGGDEKGNLVSNIVNEFISLDKKANFEYGSLTVDGKSTELSYVAALLTKKNGYTGALGVFGETKTEHIVALSSDDGEKPNFKKIIIKDKYECTNIDAKEAQSALIKGAIVLNIYAKECTGLGVNEGKVKDITIKLTQSMFVAGTSRIRVEGDKAYLETDYPLNGQLTIEGSGGLGTRAYNQIFDLTKTHPEVKTIVEGHISGSIHDDINMQTGRLIRKHGLNTHVTKTSHISSGGVDLFCSGNKRSMENGAKIGVHSWSGGDVKNASDLPEDSPLHQNQIDYFTEMLGATTGKAFYFYTINAAPADDIHQMNEAEIAEYNLLTE